MEATSRLFGQHAGSGAPVEAFTLRNSGGMSVEVTTYGATILSVKVPPRGGGTAEEVTLCHSDLPSLQKASPYFGCTVGRVANRISKGSYKVDGKSFSGVVNNGVNHLHGGAIGFDKVLWAPRVYVTPSTAGVEFSYVSKDGEEGYPGNLAVKADYRLTSTNELIMEFTATTDAPTVRRQRQCAHTDEVRINQSSAALPHHSAGKHLQSYVLESVGLPALKYSRSHHAAHGTILYAD